MDRPASNKLLYGIRKHRGDYQIVLYMAGLMLLGLVVMYAIGPQRAHVLNNIFSDASYDETHFFVRQAIYLVLALGAFIVMAKVPIQFLKTHARKLLGIAIVLSLILAVGGWLNLPFAPNIGGAHRWFNFGPLGSFQPAELLKFGVLVFGASFLALRMRRNQINDKEETLIPMAALIALTGVIVIIFQKDMGTGLSLLAIVAAMLMAAGASKRVGMIALSVLLAGVVALILVAPHRIDRVTAFMAGDNASTADASTYQIVHAKIAIGSGGPFGVGIGNSVQATGYLPEVINDAVFAVLGEMFGFIGLLIILALYAGLLLRLLMMADRSLDPMLRLLAVGIFGWLAAHVFINVGSVTGLIPLTGITLPLLSFGGTSMVAMAAALGLAFQISQYTQYEVVQKGGTDETTRRRRGVGRSRYANRRRLA